MATARLLGFLQIKSCAPQTWNLTRDNAASLSLRFSSIRVPGDQLVVSTPNGSFAQVLESAASDSFETLPIPGKALKLEPLGRPKTIAMTDDKTAAKITPVPDANSALLVSYTAETDSGSEGSPVLSQDSNLVVALHRSNNRCQHFGTPSNLLIASLGNMNNDGYGR